MFVSKVDVDTRDAVQYENKEKTFYLWFQLFRSILHVIVAEVMFGAGFIINAIRRAARPASKRQAHKQQQNRHQNQDKNPPLD